MDGEGEQPEEVNRHIGKNRPEPRAGHAIAYNLMSDLEISQLKYGLQAFVFHTKLDDTSYIGLSRGLTCDKKRNYCITTCKRHAHEARSRHHPRRSEKPNHHHSKRWKGERRPHGPVDFAIKGNPVYIYTGNCKPATQPFLCSFFCSPCSSWVWSRYEREIHAEFGQSLDPHHYYDPIMTSSIDRQVHRM